MRTSSFVTGVLMLGIALCGCGGDASSDRDAEGASDTPSSNGAPSEEETSPSDEGDVIPDGSYGKSATRAEAKAMGISDKGFLRQLGADGKTTYIYKFAGSSWTLLIDEGVPEPGDLGTLEYAEDGTVLLTSESDGCPGCVYSYDWQLAGEGLTMKVVGHESTDSPEDVQIVRFVTEGVFARQS